MAGRHRACELGRAETTSASAPPNSLASARCRCHVQCRAARAVDNGKRGRRLGQREAQCRLTRRIVEARRSDDPAWCARAGGTGRETPPIKTSPGGSATAANVLGLVRVGGERLFAEHVACLDSNAAIVHCAMQSVVAVGDRVDPGRDQLRVRSVTFGMPCLPRTRRPARSRAADGHDL